MWTIGHGAGSFTELEQRASPYGVSMIVDVRSQPHSRHAPDFARRRLELLCDEAEIGYRWLGATLGGKPEQGPAGPERPGFDEAIDELVELAASTPTVILCAELEPGACHRSTIVGAALHERGLEVTHILGDGSTRHHEPPLPFS
ncbi:MAG: DUF488 domain-containing protein [Acidimicrobiia bacterium]|nr:MAG: DUF488 domain-containing protein [Acidimicrobiia bacterium]